MARRVIQIDGDPSGLQKAASAATTTLKTELDAQKKLVADAKAAQQALGDSATAEERAAAKAQVQAAQAVLATKKQAYQEAAAAAKAVADTEKRLAKEAADAARAEAMRAADAKKQAATDAQNEAKKLYGTGPAAGPSSGLETAIPLVAAFAVIRKFAGLMEQANQEIARAVEKLAGQRRTVGESAVSLEAAARKAGGGSIDVESLITSATTMKGAASTKELLDVANSTLASGGTIDDARKAMAAAANPQANSDLAREELRRRREARNLELRTQQEQAAAAEIQQAKDLAAAALNAEQAAGRTNETVGFFGRKLTSLVTLGSADTDDPRIRLRIENNRRRLLGQDAIDPNREAAYQIDAFPAEPQKVQVINQPRPPAEP